MFLGTRSRNLELASDWEVPEDADILAAAAEALERPSDAHFWDEEVYTTHTLMFYSAPDSDDLVSQSNFRCILEDLKGAYPRAIERASIRHWTYSHFDCVKIRVAYANGEIHPAFVEALTIARKLSDYPLYDDEDFSNLEMEEWDRAISDAIEYALTDISDTEDPEEFRGYLQTFLYSEGAQLIGYHDVGYIPDEAMEGALQFARDEIANLKMLGMTKGNNSGETLFD